MSIAVNKNLPAMARKVRERMAFCQIKTLLSSNAVIYNQHAKSSQLVWKSFELGTEKLHLQLLNSEHNDKLDRYVNRIIKHRSAIASAITSLNICNICSFGRIRFENIMAPSELSLSYKQLFETS
jgi:hypothetical protein